MTTRVLGIDLHDAGRDGVYRVAPDDPVTLVSDAQRAGLALTRIDLADCHDEATCAIRRAFTILRDQSTQVLDSISLAEGAQWEERLG